MNFLNYVSLSVNNASTTVVAPDDILMTDIYSPSSGSECCSFTNKQSAAQDDVTLTTQDDLEQIQKELSLARKQISKLEKHYTRACKLIQDMIVWKKQAGQEIADLKATVTKKDSEIESLSNQNSTAVRHLHDKHDDTSLSTSVASTLRANIPEHNEGLFPYRSIVSEVCTVSVHC